MDQKIISSAAQVIIAIIPIVGISIGGIVIFFSLLWHHLEVNKQIAAGIYNRGKFDLKSYSLLIGLLLTGIGFILTLFFALTGGISPSLLGGLVPFAIGICLIIFYKVNDWN
ncbi:hypothetical protein [Treponema pectinovorum]|uniref:hypothetical protein n=1 Tax=Treponema pectinovorum TaxID=164 RepID=UPI0011CA0FF8|nr:hypothetical protein [Treponema pectinovorum]